MRLSDLARNSREQIRQASARADIGLTTADFAIAETGTLVLMSSQQQGRLASLLPHTHIAIVSEDALVPTFADVVKLLRLRRLTSPDGRLPTNISLHTGPSRTADIEQTLHRGMHGPKDAHVILVSTGQPQDG